MWHGLGSSRIAVRAKSSQLPEINAISISGSLLTQDWASFSVSENPSGDTFDIKDLEDRPRSLPTSLAQRL